MRGGEQGFDHELAGWPLRGKHATTDCARCHVARNQQGLRLYVGTDRACAACHRNDQPHQLVRPALDCGRCHGDAAWKPAKARLAFDHDDREDAAMPLLGAHAKVTCARCHAGGVFDLPQADPAACGNCHPQQHAGQLYGTRDCSWCHSPTLGTFSNVAFDHSERTTFELGAHRTVECSKCHTKALGLAKPSATCETCHASKSKHKARFQAFGTPPACGTCHSTASWRATRFDHAKRTRLGLTARHAEITCRACHRGKSPSDFEDFKGNTACKSCHEHRTVHADAQHPNGKYTTQQCLGCHVSGQGRRPDPVFRAVHFPGASFPLVNGHKSVPCADCHPGRDAKHKPIFQNASPECSGCHQDFHNGSRGAQCTKCHAPGTWKAPAT